MSGAREGPPSATLFGEPFANAGLRRPPSVEGDQSGTLLVHRNVASLRGPEEAALFADISGKRPHASAEGEELRPSSAGPSAEDWASNSHGEGKASEERTLEAAFPWPHSPPSASVRVAGLSAGAVSNVCVYLSSQRGWTQEFKFDRVFGPESSQDEVYRHTTQSIIPHVVAGINGTVFVYGATGAGKTHTMLGTEQQPGIILRTVGDLFRVVEWKKDEAQRVVASSAPGDSRANAECTAGCVCSRCCVLQDCEISVSYLEVYNEKLRDLLEPSRANLEIQEDATKFRWICVVRTLQIRVQNLSVHAVASATEALQLLSQGHRNRNTAATAANLTSSRSHAIFQVVVRSTFLNLNKGFFVKREAKLSLIDLAGSERASATLNRGDRLKEGCCINQSLLALANCINALHIRQLTSAQQQQPQGGGRLSNFVNYRNSKLTHLLKNSLEGHCLVVMIANVHPSASAFAESSNTLKYANRAKNLKVPLQLLRAGQADAENDRPRMLLLLHEQQQQLLRLQAFLKSRDSLIAKQEQELELHRRVVASQQQKLLALTQQREELKDRLEAALGGKASEAKALAVKRISSNESSAPAAANPREQQLASLSLIQTTALASGNGAEATPPRSKFTRNEDSSSRPRDPLVAAAAASVGSQSSPPSSNKNCQSLRRSRRLLPAARPCLCEGCLTPPVASEKLKPEGLQQAQAPPAARPGNEDAESADAREAAGSSCAVSVEAREEFESEKNPPFSDPKDKANAASREALLPDGQGLQLAEEISEDDAASESHSRRKRITIEGTTAGAVKRDSASRREEGAETLESLEVETSEASLRTTTAEAAAAHPRLSEISSGRGESLSEFEKAEADPPTQKRRCVRIDEDRAGGGGLESRPPSSSSVVSLSGDESLKRTASGSALLLPAAARPPLQTEGLNQTLASSSESQGSFAETVLSALGEKGTTDGEDDAGAAAANGFSGEEFSDNKSQRPLSAEGLPTGSALGCMDGTCVSADGASAASDPTELEATLLASDEVEEETLFTGSARPKKKLVALSVPRASAPESRCPSRQAGGSFSLGSTPAATTADCPVLAYSCKTLYGGVKKTASAQASLVSGDKQRRISADRKGPPFASGGNAGMSQKGLPRAPAGVHSAKHDALVGSKTGTAAKRLPPTTTTNYNNPTYSNPNTRQQQPLNGGVDRSGRSKKPLLTKDASAAVAEKTGGGAAGSTSSLASSAGVPAEGSCSSLRSAVSARSTNSAVFADTSAAANGGPFVSSVELQRTSSRVPPNAKPPRRVCGGGTALRQRPPRS